MSDASEEGEGGLCWALMCGFIFFPHCVVVESPDRLGIVWSRNWRVGDGTYFVLMY